MPKSSAFFEEKGLSPHGAPGGAASQLPGL
jgi:hypothetical protein